MHLAQSAGYGVTIYVESLLKGLPNDKYQQYLLGSEYYATSHFESITSGMDCIPMDRNITLRDLKTIVECRKIIKKRKPDILYCHSAKAGIYGRIACWGTNIKVVYNPHGWAFNMKCSKLKRFFYKIVEIGFSLITDKIVVISNYEYCTCPRLIPQKKINKILNGIDTDRCEEILNQSTFTRKEAGIPEQAFVVGLVARISIQKGQDLFIKAARKIADEIPESYFVIVGDKSDNVPIEEIINASGLNGKVLITGEVADAVKYTALFDVAVLTSRWEGFGLVLPEYMIARKPVVAFSVDAVPEIVNDGVTGILVPKEDTEGMADAVVKLYKNPELASKYASSGYLAAKRNFDLQRVIKEHDDLFESLV